MAEIDYKFVEDKAARLWTQEDIAIACGYNPDYFSAKKKTDPELTNALNRGKQRARGDIINAQFEVGVNDRDTKMLIHLGKHYLDQRDELKL